MTTVTEERQGEPAAQVKGSPKIGVVIDPDKLRRWRENIRSWSRTDLSRAITALNLIDEGTGKQIRLTTDAIAKIENPDSNRGRNPKPRSLRALCAALGCTPEQLAPGAPAPGPDPAERRRTAEHLRALRKFAIANGIRFRKPSGGMSYSRPLRDAFALAMSGANPAEVAAAVAKARREFPAEPGETAAAGPAVASGDPIDVLDLSIRTHNALVRGELPGGARRPVRTISELTSRTEAELRDIRGIGAKNLREIKSRLHDAGLALRDDAADEGQLLAS